MVAMEPIGQRLATGEMLLREVGRGALARVYLVSDGRGARALKLLPVGQAARADHEHAMAHDLDHPHLGHSDARVDVGDRPGLIMPWVKGRALRVRGRSCRDRLDYLAAFDGLLRALGHLHERRRVHRDVKPENVLVDGEGWVTLIDFDLALSLDAPEAAPRAAGTVAYLSPEQARGERATPASDLYAAGIMLYAALIGEVPFHGTAAQRLAARHPTPAPRPSDRDPALAAADALVAGLLAPAPEDRFATAAAASEALARLRAAWPDPAAGDPTS
jgi:eukaryotic-like serine/threonine-protein kinase